MIGDDQLSQFAGRWSGDEQILPTAWTTAGSAQAVLELASGPNGSLLFDYSAQLANGTLTGHGVVASGAWWWFDSYGFIPIAPGTARWERDELILERSSERGRTVTTLAIAAGRLVQRIDSAVPAEAELSPLLRGTYTLQSPPCQQSASDPVKRR
jgi:hypothetical protein